MYEKETIDYNAITHLYSVYNNIAKICPSLHYGEQEDANEFYIGLIQKLMQKLPEKYNN